MSSSLVGVLVIFGVIALYIVSYILNKNTDVPEGIEPLDKCSTCGTGGSCSLDKKSFVQEYKDEECDDFEQVEAI